MFTEYDREKILDTIIESLKKRDEILSVILVGSGSIGFRDKLSDLDLAIIVKDLNNLNYVFNKTKEEISLIDKIVSEEDMIDRKLQVFLLNNYLEVDIGYYSLEDIYARRENYKIIFDKTAKVDKLMKESWEKMKLINKGTTDIVDMKKLISYIDSILWYNVIHCVNAYYRKNKYRCYYELNDIRNIAIDLVCKRNNVESKKHRGIELLSEDDKNKIEELYCYPKDGKELGELLVKLIHLIYENMDYFKEKENVIYEIEEDYLINYVVENVKSL